MSSNGRVGGFGHIFEVILWLWFVVEDHQTYGNKNRGFKFYLFGSAFGNCGCLHWDGLSDLAHSFLLVV